MWIFTTFGFFSVVESFEDEDTLVVRARAREDLEALRTGYLPGLEIEETPNRDYRFRARCPKDRWATAAAAMAADIDYGNFKDAVAERHGYARARRYGRVWETMYGLQEG